MELPVLRSACVSSRAVRESMFFPRIWEGIRIPFSPGMDAIKVLLYENLKELAGLDFLVRINGNLVGAGPSKRHMRWQHDRKSRVPEFHVRRGATGRWLYRRS